MTGEAGAIARLRDALDETGALGGIGRGEIDLPGAILCFDLEMSMGIAEGDLDDLAFEPAFLVGGPASTVMGECGRRHGQRQEDARDRGGGAKTDRMSHGRGYLFCVDFVAVMGIRTGHLPSAPTT